MAAIRGMAKKEKRIRDIQSKGTVPDLPAEQHGAVESGLSPDIEKRDKKGGHGCC